MTSAYVTPPMPLARRSRPLGVEDLARLARTDESLRPFREKRVKERARAEIERMKEWEVRNLMRQDYGR